MLRPAKGDPAGRVTLHLMRGFHHIHGPERPRTFSITFVFGNGNVTCLVIYADNQPQVLNFWRDRQVRFEDTFLKNGSHSSSTQKFCFSFSKLIYASFGFDPEPRKFRQHLTN